MPYSTRAAGGGEGSMKAGQLSHRVQLLRRRKEQDSVGQPVPTHDVYATVWASINPITAKEYVAAAQTVNQMDVKIAFRWVRDVLPIDRVRFNGQEADVTSVVDPGVSGSEIELWCKVIR